MKYEETHFPTEPITIFKTDNEYCVELGTYLPIKKRVEDLKKAGMDLMAYRQAYSEFSNGTQNINLDDYDNELLNADEIDFMQMKAKYFEIMKKQEEIVKETQKKALEKAKNDAINAEVEKRLAEKKNEPKS